MTPNSTSPEQQESTFYCHDYDEGQTDEKCNFPCGNSWCEQKPTIYPENQEDWIKYHEKTLANKETEISRLQEEVEQLTKDATEVWGVAKEWRERALNAEAKSPKPFTIKQIEQSSIEHYIIFFDRHRRTFSGINSGEYLEKDDFFLYMEQYTESHKQKESQLTHLAGQLLTKEVEYEMMKEENGRLKSEALMQELIQHRKDLEEAAGELLVPVPEPGTDAAKMLHANTMLRKYRIPELEDRLEKSYSIEQIESEIRKMHPKSTEAFILVQLLTNLKQQKEGK